MKQTVRRPGRTVRKPRASERRRTSYGRRTYEALRHRVFLVLAFVVVLVAATGFTGINMFHAPHYEVDEGTYMGSAWALFEHGALSYYTYNYDHPILGWVQIGLWSKLVGGFLAFGSSINTGRALMLVVAVASTALIFFIVRRATGRTAAALFGAMVFAGSPLGVSLHRQVWLDNLATFWLLVSIYLLLTARGNLVRLILSAVAFGLAFWTKEIFALFLPGMLYLVYTNAHPAHRRFAFPLWGIVATFITSLFVLQAVLKDELLPPGVLWSSPKPHVSLIDTYLFQASRGSAVPPGPFDKYFELWASTDPVLVIGGLVAVTLGLLFWRRSKSLVGLFILVAFFLLFNARGGVVLFHYVIPLLALLAVSLGIFAGALINLASGSRLGATVPTLIVVALTAVWGVGQVQGNMVSFREDSTSVQLDAAHWVADNLPSDSTIIMDSYPWVDLREKSFANGKSFSNAHYYWPAQLDPEIREDSLQGNWRNVDYLLLSRSTAENIAAGNPEPLPLMQKALSHATEIKTFENKYYDMQVFRVTGVEGDVAAQSVPAPEAPDNPGGSDSREAQNGDTDTSSEERCAGADTGCIEEVILQQRSQAGYVGGRTDTGGSRSRAVLYFEDPTLKACQTVRREGAGWVAIVAGEGSFNSGNKPECVPDA